MRFNEFFQPQNLNEFAPAGGGIPPRGPKVPGRDPWGDDDDRWEDPYKYPKPQHYSRSIEFFGKFEADHFDREDMNDATGEFKGYWGKTQIAYFKFDDPKHTGSDDPGMGWYYEPELDSDSDSTNASPVTDRDEERKQQELGMIDAFLKSGKKPNPGSPIYHLMKRHGFKLEEARRNPERNLRAGSGKYDLINYAEDIRDKDNWAVSMTMEPKLGINPRAAVSEDTPKGIYFYPLRYFMQMADRDESLPWGNNFSYLQLFQYDRSNEMTQQTKVDPERLKQALLQYCPEDVIQQAMDEPEYDGTPYWIIYDCLSRLGKGDETNVVRWNKVLRDLGFTSVYDPGRGWIAYNEPTQGVVLDPRIIKQHKMFSNRNPTMQNRRYDLEGLSNSIGWSSYYQREKQLQRVPHNHPDENKVRLDVAKTMLRQFLGKSGEEAEAMGYKQALIDASDKVIEILKQRKTDESVVSEDAEPWDREKQLVKKLGQLGSFIVSNPMMWEKYSDAIDSDNIEWIIGLIQDKTGANREEVMHLAELFGEIGGGGGRLVDFAWAVKEDRWIEDFMKPYIEYKRRHTEAANPAQQAAIAIAKKKAMKEGVAGAEKMSGLVDIPAFTASGTSKIVNTGDRIMAVVDVGGVYVPYYISTGEGGKASVPTGKWYPVFGRHTSGWLNKGGESSINQFYGSKMLELYAKRLNNSVGNIADDMTVPAMKKAGDSIINKDMQPMSHSEANANPKEFMKRVNNVLVKIGSKPYYNVSTTESRESISKALLKEFPVAESAGYIAQTPEEAKDPRFSMSMTIDVGIHTMQEQLAAFFPTTAPKDGQAQVQEATYHGREVKLGIPVKQGQHYFVYQRDPITQKVKKVIHIEPVKKVKQVRQRHPR